MPICSFGEKSKSLLFPFLMGLFFTIRRMGTVIVTRKIGKHPYFSAWQNYIGQLTIIILYFIQNKKSKTTMKTLRMPKVDKKITKYRMLKPLLIAFCTFLDFNGFVTYILLQSNNKKNDKVLEFIYRMISFAVLAVFSMLILKYNYYRHHLLGGVIIVIGTIVFIFTQSFKFEMLSSDIGYYILQLGLLLFDSLIYIIEKYLMDTIYLSPYLIEGIEGLIGSIVISLLFFILWSIPCLKESNFCTYDSKKSNQMMENFFGTIGSIIRDKECTIWFLIEFIGRIFYNLFGILTVQAFSPIHTSIAEATIKDFSFWLFCNIVFNEYFEENKDSGRVIIIKSISFFINFVGYFIFLEILILNTFEMNRNTGKEISLRINEEKFEILNFAIEGYKKDKIDEFGII